MKTSPTPTYGSTRVRLANVSPAEVHRAALDILASGQRPSVQSVRKLLGRGSPATLAAALSRFWRELGIRAEGNPAAMQRLPSDIADLADGLWQKALTLASQSAKQDDNAARERLQQLRLETELRAQSFAQREKEYEAAARTREQLLTEMGEHLRATLGLLERDRATLKARDTRIADLETQLEALRAQLAALVTRAVVRYRQTAQRKAPVPRKAAPARRARPAVAVPPKRKAAKARATRSRARRARPSRTR